MSLLTPERMRLKRIAGIVVRHRAGGGRKHRPAGHPVARVDDRRGGIAWDPEHSP